MVEFSYERSDEPVKVGEYHGRDILQFGMYRVQLGDFTYLLPHTAVPGTVGADPASLADPHVQGALLVQAQAASSSTESPSERPR